MKLNYISLRWYFSALFGFVTIIGSALFSYLAIDSMEQDSVREGLLQRDSIGRHFDQLLRTQNRKLSDMSVILPLVHADSEHGSDTDFDSDLVMDYRSMLDNIWEDIEVFWGIDRVFLLDANGTAVFSNLAGEQLPPYRDWLDAGINIQEEMNIHCDDGGCYLYSFTPIANIQGVVGYLVFGEHFFDVLTDLSKTQNIGAAMVSYEPSQGYHQYQGADFPAALLSLIPSPKDILIAKVNANISWQGITYRADLMPVASKNTQPILLLSLADITDKQESMDSYIRNTLFLGVAIFLLTVSLVVLGLRPVTRRLHELARFLPQLSDGSSVEMIKKLRYLRPSVGLLPHTELDVVVASCRQLVLRLSKSAKQVRQRTQELEDMAMTDSLTGLPNRNMLHYELEKSLAERDRRGEMVGLCMLDIDDFKLVNDSLGHDEGDVLIQQVGKRLLEVVRETDQVYRLGGDEFVLLFPNLKELEDLHLSLVRLMAVFEEPVQLTTRPIKMSVSIGVVAITHHGSVDQLLKRADIAMYKAKEQSGCSYELFDDGLAEQAHDRLQIISAIPRALENNEFSLYLQPQVELSTGSVVGFEALIRWFDPECGFIAPDQFIPHLERSHYMLELSYWVLEESMRLLQRLDKEGFGDLAIAVNLSPQQFTDHKLKPAIMGLLKAYNMPAKNLHLEITEGSVMRDLDGAIEIISSLRDEGVLMAMDDFGTGHSSLSHLQRLPLDILKIDRSFVSGMLESELDHQIVKSTIEFARVLDMEVVAEGIEHESEQKKLIEMGCGMAQGYYFARPMPFDDVIQWLKKQNV